MGGAECICNAGGRTSSHVSPARRTRLNTLSLCCVGRTSNNQPIAISEDLQSILNVEINPDGRPVRVVFDYHNDSRAGIFSLQPFFDEQVCFIFPPQPIPPQYNAFEIGVEFLWFNQAWEPTVMASYNQSKFNGTDSIAGQACDRCERPAPAPSRRFQLIGGVAAHADGSGHRAGSAVRTGCPSRRPPTVIRSAGVSFGTPVG